MSSATKVKRLSNSIDLLADQIKQLNLGDSNIAAAITKNLNPNVVCPFII